MSDFSERLKRALDGAGQTQGWLAARFNGVSGGAVTSATVGRWVNGVNQPTLEQIVVLARVLRVSPCALAFGEEAESAAATLRDDALALAALVDAARAAAPPAAPQKRRPGRRAG